MAKKCNCFEDSMKLLGWNLIDSVPHTGPIEVVGYPHGRALAAPSELDLWKSNFGVKCIGCFPARAKSDLDDVYQFFFQSQCQRKGVTKQ